MARPGGNLTGFAGVADVPAKWIELFKELVPKLRRVLALIDPDDPVTPRYLAEVRRAAELLKLKLVEREVRTAADIERVFASIKRGDVDGVVLASVNLRGKFSSLITVLPLRNACPCRATGRNGRSRARSSLMGVTSHLLDRLPLATLIGFSRAPNQRTFPWRSCRGTSSSSTSRLLRR